MEQAAPSADRARRRRARADRAAVPRRVRPAQRRLRRRAEVSAAVRAAVPAARARAHRRRRSRAEMVLRTLRAMALGGMRDHIGGGFHRYSVDGGWRVPHFEKMLYDQAQLVLAFVEAAQVSGDPFYAEVAEDTLLYVMREMTDAGRRLLFGRGRRQHPAGGRRAAPAPHKTEGAFYLWRADELDALLGDDAADREAAVRHRAGRQRAARSAAGVHRQEPALRRAIDRRDRARRPASRADEVVDVLHRARLTMFKERLGRPRPHRDDKVLTAWNGLMIAAFARMARALRGLGADGRTAGAPYLDAARRAAAFVRERMWNAAVGRAAAPLPRRPRRDRRLRRGLRLSDLRAARAVSGRPGADVARVGDRAAAPAGRAVLGRGRPAAGSARPGSDPSVLLRMKEDYDGAEPTASSVSVLNLLVLSHLVARCRVGRPHRADAAAVRRRGSSRWAAACR